MSGDWQELWSTLPEKAQHPVRVPIIEALWWVGEPLSAIALVDSFDGFLSMWEAAHHLRVLESLGVVASDQDRSPNDRFHVRYRLTERPSGQGS